MTQKSSNLPEITVKAVLLSIVLTVVLAAANAFLGLKVGLTVSASIPAAVISMAFLRMFREHSILENDIVQTAASAGEALTAVIIFTIPALIVISYWQKCNYLQLVGISALGGTLGVLFSVPLRRVLLADKSLPFPEGTAIGNVLKASTLEEFSIRNLIFGGVIGALIKVFQLGFKVLSGSAQYWVARGSTVVGIGFGFDPALIGAGYIIGINIGLSILLGIVIGWLVGVPIIALVYGVPVASNSSAMAMALWSDYIRYIGLGVMMVGGIWAIVMLVKPMFKGIVHSIESLTVSRKHGMAALPREERDIPINWVLWLILV